MAEKKQKVKPTTFIAIGICYIGSGIALGAALQREGASVIGISLVGIGITFLVIGIVNRKKGNS